VSSVSLLLVLAGCSKGFLEEELAGMRHLTTRLNSNVGGTAQIKVPVLRQDSALLATAQVDPPLQVHFRLVEDARGSEVFRAFEWNDSPYSKTNGGFVADVATLNWPVHEDDPGLSEGKWRLEFGVVDGQQRYTAAPIFLDVLLKDDDEFDSGELAVSIVYTEDLEDDDSLREAVDQAREIWRDLYAELGLDISFESYGFPAEDLEAPAFGSERAYIDIAGDTEPRSVNLVISDSIEGVDEEIFGIAGDIPGPLVPTTRSAVQISSRLAAGTDGEFDDEDIRLLAETMAHEVAHYLGLFHPVEATWDAWDVLEDTPECDSMGECEGDLGDNLMFPYPVCIRGVCTPQDMLTDEQASVVNRNVAVW
jgi:hypothetical protein